MSFTPHRFNTRAEGMTLVELMVTIAVLCVVTTALMTLIQSFYKDNSYLIDETSALASARAGVTTAASILREASYGADGSYPIAAAATSSVTVYADADQDSTIEQVTYSLKNGALYQVIVNATGTPLTYSSALTSTSTISTNVRNTAATPLFTYYDDQGAQLSTTSTNISDISSIKVQLLVDLNPNRAPNVFTLVQSSTLRNLEKE